MKKNKKGRKPIQRSLPPMAEVCLDFKGFAKSDHRSERIYQILLGLIQRYRQTVPRPFYAMREAADFFNVSLTLAYKVYRRLQREGVLTIMRSSQTMIVPRAHRPKLALRGIVCMPIWLPGFLQFLDWRRQFSELETELSRHHFVLEPVFYRQGEEISSDFVDRVLKFNPDYVFWDGPVQTDRSTMQGITDAGVPLLSVLGPSDTLPGRIYRRSYSRGLQRGIEDWTASGEVDRIIMPHISKEMNSPYLMAVLNNCSLPHEPKIYHIPDSLTQYFKQLNAIRRAGIIFGNGFFFVQLCTLAPTEMFNLFRRHRVIIMHQVTIPTWVLPTDIMVDGLFFPTKRLARRIAADLSQFKGALPSTEEVIEAEWKPRIPLATVTQEGFHE